MKKQLASLTFVVLLALAVVGCQTGAKGPSDEELIQGATNTFINGLVSKNVDAALAVVSDDFTNPQATDKAGLRTFMTDAIDSGYLDDAEADFSGIEYKLEGDTATAYPIVINSAAGSATLGIELIKKAGAWMVSGMDVEGV